MRLYVFLLILCWPWPVAAEVVQVVPRDSRPDTLWILVSAALVFFMQIGFLMLEAGMVRSKNSINVALKNVLDFVFGALAFATVGFMLAFAAPRLPLPFGADPDWFLLGAVSSELLVFFIFQVMFCATAATIISGAVAERMRLSAYVVTSVVVSALIYPIFAHWAWGASLAPSPAAFLANLGFVDFAGSTVVHATGAWAALAACLVLGPRLGRADAAGNFVRMQGHSPVLVAAGGLILFVGWLGFNGGSRLVVDDIVPVILVNTILAGAAGACVGFLLGGSQVIRPEAIINGMLGGLVAVTAGCHVLAPWGAVLVGALGSVCAALGNRWLERLRIDDAVGAIGVHGCAGVAGTLALALVAPVQSLPAGDRLAQLAVQATAVAVHFLWVFGTALLFFAALKHFMPLRVSTAAEEEGLNVAEHGARLGVGHVEAALDALVSGRADLAARLPVEPGDEAERLTRLFNRLMATLEVTERQKEQQKEALRTAAEAGRMAALVDATFEGLAIARNGTIVDGNRPLFELLGGTAEEVRGLPLHRFVGPHDWSRLRVAMAAQDAAPLELELHNLRGERIPVEVRVRDFDVQGAPAQVFAVADLRARREAEATIYRLALHDPLTDLPNRAQFNRRLPEVCAVATPDARAALLLIDLDRFKEVNDIYGHPAGDTVIRVTGERLRALLGPADFVARLGGDEFAVIQANVAFNAQIADLALRIIDRLNLPIEIGPECVVSCGASVGIAVAGEHAHQPDQLFSRADTALYVAKNAGRNRYACYEPGMDEALRDKQQLTAELSLATERGELELYLQPRVGFSSCEVTGYEALVRWNHPGRGLVSPGVFIPLAEQSGLIVPLGAWVLREACACAMRTLGEVAISVNVSAVQLYRADFVAALATVLAETGLPPGRLELELTETALLHDAQRAAAILSALRKLGVKLALDDFGTGYSSLSYLSHLPFNSIKIDRAFVQGAHTNERDGLIIQTIVQLAHGLGMSVTAEGVELPEHIDVLRRLGCDELQGYLLGKPEPVAARTVTIPTEVRARMRDANGVAALRSVAAEMERLAG